MSKLQKAHYWVMIICAISITIAIISVTASAQEDEIWSDPYPAEIIREVRESGQADDDDLYDGYDYDELGPFPLRMTQMIIAPSDDRPVPDEIPDKEKETPKAFRYKCKVQEWSNCWEIGKLCSFKAVTGDDALECLEKYEECWAEAKQYCENKHPLEVA